MPVMLRPKDKATKIAYAILGVPDNIKFKRTPTQQRIDDRLRAEETSRVK